MLSRWQSTIVDAQGNVQPLANLTVRLESDQSLAKMWASPGTSQPLPDGMVQADGNGYAYFYAEGGLYRIQSDDLNIDWRHVPMGNLAAMDSDQLAGELGLGSAATRDVGTGPDDVPTNGLIFATFADVIALTEDQGPIICTDQDGILYAWDSGTNKYVAQTADNETALAKSSPTNLLTPSGLGFSLQPHIEGSAAFTRIDNQIVLTGIVPTLALEVGDVIEITGSASNNRLHTVESIADDDTIIVNYEHRNGAGSLSVVDETTNVTIKRIAKWFNAPLGLGQAWVDVIAIRAGNTNYTSPTNRTTSISVCGHPPLASQMYIALNGEKVAMHQLPTGTADRSIIQLQANMPGEVIYSVQNSEHIGVWAELR